jgi:X-X-X-Leu-X-X-Gly heptad repeat protein
MGHATQKASKPRGFGRRILGNWRGVATGTAVVVLGTVVGVTLSGFSGTISNGSNAFASGTVQLKEGVGAATCFSTGSGTGGFATASNTGTCSIIDDLGDKLDQVPGGTAAVTTITMTNVGSVATSPASLVAGACSAAAASDNGGYTGSDTTSFCGKVEVTIGNTSTGAVDKCVFPDVTAAACAAPSTGGTLATLASQTLSSPGLSNLAAGATSTYVITVQLDSSASNADQGLTATLLLTWGPSQ